MSFKFQAIEQPSVVDTIIEAVKQALISGELKPGQKLPSEAELVQQLKVGRSAVREAIKVMQALGVVRTQQGDGTYVVEEASPALLNPLVFTMLLEAGISSDLVNLRRIIEFGYCALAAENATHDDWQRIEEAAQAHADYVTDPDLDFEQLVRLDLEFHRRILDASHNALMLRLGHAIEELFFASMKRTYMTVEGNLEQSVHFHREIVNSIRDGNPTLIYQAITNSLIYWREEVWKLGTHSEAIDI